MNIKWRYYLLTQYLLVICLPQARALQETLIDKVVAKIDSQVVLQSELEFAYQQYLLQGNQEISELKCKILNSLMLEKALLAEAKQEKIKVENEEIVYELSRRMQYLIVQAGSEAKIAQHLGKPIAEIKSELREKIKEQLIIKKVSNRIIKEITATPQEVETFLATLTDQEIPYYPTEVVVRQIVRYPTVSQQEIESLIAKLRDLKVRLQNGERFEDLAQLYSQDVGSALRGGELGFRRPGELTPAYEAVALALQPGEIAEPVVTQFGVHLIQLVGRKKDQYNSRHILLKPHPSTYDLSAAETYLTQLRTSILAGEMTFEEAARNSSEDVITASVGGLLTREQGGVKMLIDDLPSEIFFAIEQLMPGEVSYPQVFKTADDQEAVRILFLEEKTAPHQANLTQDYAKIQQLLINKKQLDALEKWFKDAKTKISIEIAPEYQHCELTE